jgi:hypothetical protein
VGADYGSTVAITSGQDDDPEVGEGAEGYVAYELHGWARESRGMLVQLLESADLPYAWEGTDLVAPAVFEERIDALVDQVEATDRPTLDPDADKLAYDLDDWSDAACTQLAQHLAEVGIAYEFDVEGALVVLADDEEAVEAALDAVEFPDALEEDDGDAGDEPDAQQVLSELFLAADRLRRNARDADGVLGLVGAAASAEGMRLPFGFEPRSWEVVKERAAALKAAIEEDTTADGDIEEQAEALRSLLRELV